MRFKILLPLILCLSLILRAELPTDDTKNSDQKRWRNGYIVNLKGDTIQGRIKVNDFLDVNYDYQRTVAFRDATGTTEYTPNDLQAFSYTEDKNTSVYLQSVSSPEGDGHVFLKVYYTGACKVYGLIVTEIKGDHTLPGAQDGSFRSSLIPQEKKYIQVGGGQFYQIKRLGFKRSMQEVFASSPRILSALEAKQYTYENWQTLVTDYNNGLK